jgi:hypothetical protein
MPLPNKSRNVFAAPVAKAYRPTMRDQAGSLLSSVLGNTYQGNRIARNVFGSSGLGGGQGNLLGGLGLLDLTPIGAAFALEEAGRQIGGGQPVTGAANVALGMVPIPAVAKGGKAVVRSAARRVAGKAAKAAPAPKPGFVAYHGSPHTFDQFDTAKIGTGEGAQAYGHGLYFAENEGVARDYRDKLSRSAGNPKTGVFRGVDAAHLRTLGDKPSFEQIMAHAQQAYDLTNMTKEQRASAAIAIAKQMQRGITPDELLDLAARARLTKKSDFALRDPGNMYQVRINADPNDFLDWDKPLGQQPESVRASLERAGMGRMVSPETLAVSGGPMGQDIINEASAKFGRNYGERFGSAGIPGIKYLDQGSRGAGEGSRNFVVFDPRIIDIMKRYGVAAPVAAAILAGTMQPPKGKEPGA